MNLVLLHFHTLLKRTEQAASDSFAGLIGAASDYLEEITSLVVTLKKRKGWNLSLKFDDYEVMFVKNLGW